MVGRPRKDGKPGQPKKVDMSDEQILKAAKKRREAAKKEKGPLEGQVLFAPSRPGFVRRWVQGSEQRLDQLTKKGYSLVKDAETEGQVLTSDLGTAKSQIVGTQKSGAARRDYLMEIPEELYLEDQKIKEQKTQQLADAHKHVEHDADELATPEGRSKIYQPR